MSVRTLKELVGHFARRQKVLLIPLLIVLMLAALLLVVTSGFAYVAPFVYALF